MKRCPQCKTEKPEDAFGFRTMKGVVRPNSWCKDCRNAYNRKWQAARPKTPELKRQAKTNKLRHKFGIDADIYDVMLVAQNGVCAICRTNPDCRSLAVDHCHKTGKIRGLLCSGCNTGIGHLRDDPLLLRVAADYVEQRT